MKITDIRTYNVFSFRTNFVFVEIYTDEWLSGLGEGTLEYKENALLGAIEDIKRVLIGQDPMEIERITSLLYRDSYWRVGKAVDIAVDFHGRVSPAMSIRLLKELEPYVRHLCAQQLHV